MKTKVIQHVENEWMRDWKSARVWEWEYVRVTFEHRHENKSFQVPSACLDFQTFLAVNQLYELKSHRIGCCGCPKKTIAIFGYKQWLLSIEMKTKVVQHVESDWMREWGSVRVWECESVKVREWFLSIDMKTKVVQHVESEWMREWKSDRVRE